MITCDRSEKKNDDNSLEYVLLKNIFMSRVYKKSTTFHFRDRSKKYHAYLDK